MRWERDDRYVTTQPEEINMDIVFEFLHNKAYWCKNIPFEVVSKAIEHSVSFSVYYHKKFAGYGRLVTDYATFAYLGDVFVLEQYRGNGLGHFLVECVNVWIDEHNIRTSLLITSDAQGLYEAHNWQYFESINRVMRYPKANFDFYNSTDD